MQQFINRGSFAPQAAPIAMQRGRPAAPNHRALPAPGNALTDLAESLGALNPTLARMAHDWALARQQEAAGRFANELARTPDAEIAKYRDAIRPGLGDLERNALDQQFGIRMANKRRRQVEKGLLTGELDPVHMDVEAYVAELAQADLAAYPSAQFAAAYNGVLSPQIENLRDVVVKAEAENHRDTVLQNFHGIVGETIEEWREKDGDPRNLVAVLNGIKDLHGPNTPLNIPRKVMDDVMMDFAFRAAVAGEADLFTALIDSPRGDAPALGTVKGRAKEVEQLRATLQRTLDERAKEALFMDVLDIHNRANNGTLRETERAATVETLRAFGYTPNSIETVFNTNRTVQQRIASEAAAAARRVEVQNLQTAAIQQGAMELAQGTFGLTVAAQAFTSADGELTVTMSKDTYRDAVIDYAMQTQVLPNYQRRAQEALQIADEAEREAALNRVAAEAALAQMKTLADNGITEYGPFRQHMTAGFNAAQIGETTNPAVAAGFQAYKQAEAISPGFAQKLVGTREVADFYQSLDLLARHLHGGNVEQALTHAVTFGSPEHKERMRFFDQEVSKKDKEKWRKQVRRKFEEDKWWSRWAQVPNNQLVVDAGIDRYARMFSTMGYMDPEGAYDLAVEAFMNNHTVVNGVIVENRSVNYHHPERLPEINEAFTTAFVAQYPEARHDDRQASEFALIPHPQQPNIFMLLDKATGLPIGDADTAIELRVGDGETARVPTFGLTQADIATIERAMTYERRVQMDFDRSGGRLDPAKPRAVRPSAMMEMMAVETPQATRKDLESRSTEQLEALAEHLEKITVQRGSEGDKLYKEVQSILFMRRMEPFQQEMDRINRR